MAAILLIPRSRLPVFNSRLNKDSGNLYNREGQASIRVEAPTKRKTSEQRGKQRKGKDSEARANNQFVAPETA
jgi:hypothetical protein